MTFKVIRGQGQGQEITSVPFGTIFIRTQLHHFEVLPILFFISFRLLSSNDLYVVAADAFATHHHLLLH